MRIVATLPSNEVGIAVNEFGVATNDCLQSGNTYNPEGKSNGLPPSSDRQVGDLGNIPASGALDTTNDLALLDGEHSIVGRSFVVHAAKDLPGSEGNIVACGTIELASTPSSVGKATHAEASGADFTYAIFEDADIYNYWQYWVSRNMDRATPAQKENRLKFSTYAIEVKCTTADTDGKGCCLQDMSEEANGGFCLIQSGTAATASMDTYRLNWRAMTEFTKDGATGDKL